MFETFLSTVVGWLATTLHAEVIATVNLNAAFCRKCESLSRINFSSLNYREYSELIVIDVRWRYIVDNTNHVWEIFNNTSRCLDKNFYSTVNQTWFKHSSEKLKPRFPEMK